MFAELDVISNMVCLQYGGMFGELLPYRVKINNMRDFLRLFRSTASWYSREGTDNLYAPYTGKTKKVFDDIVEEKKGGTISKSSPAPVGEGTSKLIIRPHDGSIHLARRTPKDKYSKYCIPISNCMRDEFIQDVRTRLPKSRGYVVEKSTDSSLYMKWFTITVKESR